MSATKGPVTLDALRQFVEAVSVCGDDPCHYVSVQEEDLRQQAEPILEYVRDLEASYHQCTNEGLLKALALEERDKTIVNLREGLQLKRDELARVTAQLEAARRVLA